jgi:hypothetical protein
LHLLFELIAGTIFALSSGLLFNERFRRSYVAIAVASAIATTSSVFLLRDVFHQLTGMEKSAATPVTTASWNSKGSDSFSAADLKELASSMQVNACRVGCTGEKFELMRLPLGGVEGDRPIYKVTHIEDGFCGSGGCMTAVMVLDKGRLYIVREDRGMGDRQAMLIAREAVSIHAPARQK